jgi:hypothetical protein
MINASEVSGNARLILIFLTHCVAVRMLMVGALLRPLLWLFLLFYSFFPGASGPIPFLLQLVPVTPSLLGVTFGGSLSGRVPIWGSGRCPVDVAGSLATARRACFLARGTASEARRASSTACRTCRSTAGVAAARSG